MEWRASLRASDASTKPIRAPWPIIVCRWPFGLQRSRHAPQADHFRTVGNELCPPRRIKLGPQPSPSLGESVAIPQSRKSRVRGSIFQKSRRQSRDSFTPSLEVDLLLRRCPRISCIVFNKIVASIRLLFVFNNSWLLCAGYCF